MKKFFFVVALILLANFLCIAENKLNQSLFKNSAPIVLKADTLFYLHAPIGPFSVHERAAQVSEKINQIIENELIINKISINEKNGFVNISYLDNTILTVTPLDTINTNKTQLQLASQYLRIIKQNLYSVKREYSLKNLLINSVISFLLFTTMVLLFWLFKKVFPSFYNYLQSDNKLSFIFAIKNKEIFSASTIYSFIIFSLRLVRLGLSLVIVYYFVTISLSLFPTTKNFTVKPILGGILYTIYATAIFYALNRLINSFFQILNIRISEWKNSILKTINIKNIQIFSEERLVEITAFSTRIAKYLFMILLTYLYFAFVFSFFSFSQTWAQTLLTYFMIPINKVINAFVSYIPNLATIIVIVVIVNYTNKFLHVIFDEIGSGKIVLENFPVDWADPTFKIIRFLVIAFAITVIFPYLPGSSSPIFQGISVFIGILFSLGSSSAISNIVSGVVLTYMRPFKIGDRVKIAETTGDIIERTLLVTRVRTVKNVDITIPNSMILGSHIINYSSSATHTGLILHTTVTIGYDVPWNKVHELLIAAAMESDNILPEPKPFVLQTSLEDFYVSYELNAYTKFPNIMAKTYSELHQNIQNKFNEANVEIMSPHYSAVRDGNQTTIPEDYLPKSYSAPSFRISDIFNIKK